MARGRLSRHRIGALALAVLAVHALLLKGVLDALEAKGRGPLPRPAATLQVRTLLRTSPGRADAAIVAAAPPATPLQAAPQAAPVTPARRPATPRDAAPLPATQDTLPPPAPTAPERAPSRQPTTPDAARAPADAPVTGAVPVTASVDLPVYRTLVPPAFAFGYELKRGVASGSGELRWQPEGDHYRARLAGSAGDAALLAWDSVGGFDDAGIAPQRYTDRRRDRSTQAANFRRDAGKVTFSGPAVEHPLPPGAQDRLSWMLQLAAIAAAEPALVGPGGRVSFLVVGARGDADVWTFVHGGEETLVLPVGSATTVRLLRLPGRAYDTRAEVWLDPARHYLPVRARLSNASDSDALLLVLREVLPLP